MPLERCHRVGMDRVTLDACSGSMDVIMDAPTLVVGCARLLKEHGYPKTALVALSQDVLSSAAALRAARADAEARGELEEPDAAGPPSKPTFAAMPQFSMIGPVYLQVYKLTDSRAVAVLAASLVWS
ncbi:hypothetical protein AK812_SmicGene8965 [Symbiodinium microadriaticum]|uniref:Uncharacterized protein n=1 Tax=Symbiodinium microadriaticum TaxID=2951 RepID=A0A1Q9EJH7_SYMMI|nr:hypothetical protein AK812_SmicGene8965 [Symbiodinium microadriaticum]